MTELYSATITYLYCNVCGKQISTGFYSIPTKAADKGIIIRAWIECPECMEKRNETKSYS